MATDEFVDAVSYGERLKETLQKVDKLQKKVDNQQRALDNKDSQIKKLKSQLASTQDNYARVCRENRQLNAIFNEQKWEAERRTERAQALKDAREKAKVEEEERLAVREKRRQQNNQLEDFLDFKRRRYH